jgi:predicted nucleic acid-binding protein
MVVVDSSVWVDYFNGKVTKQTDLLESLLVNELVVIGDIILTEVLQR